MDELTTITKKEANRLILKEIKRELVGAGLAQVVIVAGSVAMNVPPDYLYAPKIVGGGVILGGIAITLIKSKEVYNTLKAYFSNRSEYVKKKYHKELVE